MSTLQVIQAPQQWTWFIFLSTKDEDEDVRNRLNDRFDTDFEDDFEDD